MAELAEILSAVEALKVDARDSPADDDGRPFLGNWLTNERAELVGRNLAAMRAASRACGYCSPPRSTSDSAKSGSTACHGASPPRLKAL